MALRDFSEVAYLPLLSLRQSEMRAVEELPSGSKDRLLPLFFLGPWGASHTLEKSLERIQMAYPDRPFLLEMPIAGAVEKKRLVHDELDNLRLPSGGYANWTNFVEERPNVIPVVQLSAVQELDEQLDGLAALTRGVAVRLPQAAFGAVQSIAKRLGAFFDPKEVLIILDYERQTRELLARQAAAVAISSSILEALPGVRVAWSASSFPDGFAGITAQDIYERQFFNGVQDKLPGVSLLYSDRGSARVERQSGGGGSPAPRVDVPQRSGWAFFRQEDAGDRKSAYQTAAYRAMADDSWDENLNRTGSSGGCLV